MADGDKSDAKSGAAGKGAKSKKMMILIIAAVVLLGGGAAVFMMMKGGGSDKAAKKDAKNAVEELKAEAEGESGEEAASEEEGEEKSSEGEKSGEKAEKGEKKEGEAKGEKGAEGAEVAEEQNNSLVYKMKAITANLNEPNFKRMVAIEFVLEARDKSAYKEIEKTTYRLTDSIIGLLSNKTQADLKSEAGKELLKQEVLARTDQILGKGKVVFVGFEQFYFF